MTETDQADTAEMLEFRALVIGQGHAIVDS